MTSRLLRRYYPDVSTRITVPFLVAIIIVAVVGVFIVTQLVAGSLQQRFINQLADSAKAALNTVIETERQQLAVLRQMVFTDGVFEAILTRDTAALETTLLPIVSNQRVDSMIVFDQDGLPLLLMKDSGRIVEILPDAAIAQRPGIQRLITQQVDRLGDKYVDIIHEDDDTFLYFAAPVVGSDGIVRGGITTGIATTKLILNIRLQALSDVVLYDAQGVILGDSFEDAALPALQLAPDAVAAYMQADNVVEQRIINNSEYQMLYKAFALREQPIGLMMVGLPIQFISQQIGTSRTTFIALFGGLFVGISLLGLVVARSIINPVNHLVNTTRAIRDGDLTRRVHLQMPDELGELAISFDHMTDDLVKSQQEIEQLYLEQVQETARRDAILTGISDSVLVLDTNSRLFFHNQAADKMIRSLSHNAAQYNAFRMLCAQPQQLTEARNVSLLDRHYSVLATPVIMDKDRVIGHVIVFRDITGLIQAERLKDEMIRQLSHELRTPLTAARGYADLVVMFNRATINEKGMEFMQKATGQLDVLNRMVNTVIEVSAILANDFELDRQIFDLKEVVQAAVADAEPMMQPRQLRLTTLLPRASVHVNGDVERIHEVIEHLLRNSANYTLDKGWVEVSVELHDQTAHLIITDNGVGIAPDEIERVFERMYRGHSAEAGPTDARGLGMGLFISKYIVEAHQGSIHIDSQPGLGTLVTVTLPLVNV